MKVKLKLMLEQTLNKKLAPPRTRLLQLLMNPQLIMMRFQKLQMNKLTLLTRVQLPAIRMKLLKLMLMLMLIMRPM